MFCIFLKTILPRTAKVEDESKKSCQNFEEMCLQLGLLISRGSQLLWGVYRDIERSFLFLVLQTHRKSFLHICEIEWFMNKQICVDGNVFICSEKDLIEL